MNFNHKLAKLSKLTSGAPTSQFVELKTFPIYYFASKCHKTNNIINIIFEDVRIELTFNLFQNISKL